MGGVEEGRERACKRPYRIEPLRTERNCLLALDDFIWGDELQRCVLSVSADRESQFECRRSRLVRRDVHLTSEEQIAKLTFQPTLVGLILYRGLLEMHRETQRLRGVKRFANRLRRFGWRRRLGRAAAQPNPGREQRKHDETDEPPRIHFVSG